MSKKALRPPNLISGPVQFNRDRLIGLPKDSPANGDGRPVTERWRECCRYYRFNEALSLDLPRCGLCAYYDGDSGDSEDSGAAGICMCDSNRRESK